MDDTTLARFMAKVDRTGDCWVWTGSKAGGGYAQFWINGRGELVHRLSYLHYHGEIPEGLVVRHKCRNRHCVNPDHLEAGTGTENQLDRVRDGTDNLGEKSSSAKLTVNQVLQIRILAEIGVDRRYKTLANMFGVKTETIYDIVNRRTWKHIH